jgi:hypothetical protein
MIKISVILVILVGGLTLFGNAGLAGFYFPRITHTDLDYALMPFLGYLSIVNGNSAHLVEPATNG